jgi:hypothetical protein
MIHNTKIVPPLVLMLTPLRQGTGHQPCKAHAKAHERFGTMSEIQFASLLRSLRSTTQEDVDRATAARDRSHMTAADRFDMITHNTPQGGSEH